MKRILSVLIVSLCVLRLYHFAAANTENILTESVIEQDNNLLLIGEITYPYQKPAKPSASFGIDESRSGEKIYSETEISETPFTIFDEENRLVYALAHGTRSTASYPYDYEEDFYERNDAAHTCRHILYQSDVKRYDLTDDFCYYVYDRHMQEVEYCQFSETGNLISYLHYSKYIGVSTPSSATDDTVLYYKSGYLAEYDGEYLITEIFNRGNLLSCNYHVYQYDDDGNCTMQIVATDHQVTLYTYEYDESAGKVTRYEYLVDGKWELTCEDGCSYSFHSGYFDWITLPVVKKTAADGTVLTEIYYAKGCDVDVGQQDCLIIEEPSRYIVVQPSDSLWSIAEQYYGNGIYSSILYQANQNNIGEEKDILQPGMRLYIPEIWNSSGDIINLY